MPPRPKKICSWYGCGAYALGSSCRCEQHTVKAWSAMKKKGTTTERGYGAAWRRIRIQILDRDSHLCQCPDCLGGRIRLRPATEVDHIIPKSDPRCTDDWDNLRSVNTLCHRKLTAAQATAGRKA